MDNSQLLKPASCRPIVGIGKNKPKPTSPRDILRDNEVIRMKATELDQENTRLKNHFSTLRLAKGALARSLEVMITDYQALATQNDKQWQYCRRIENEMQKLKHDMLRLVAESSVQIKNLSSDNEKLKGLLARQIGGHLSKELLACPNQRKRKKVDESATQKPIEINLID